MKACVLADDLTGAAEIAGLGHGCGLSVRLVRDAAAAVASDADVVVVDLDTRLRPADEAAEAVQRAVEALPRPERLAFLKIDSVLRGPVAAMARSFAAGLAQPRIVVLSANPSLGRTIREGRYAVDGRPLEAAGFSDDPHHPIRTSSVAALLGEDAVSVGAEAVWPEEGIVVPDAPDGASLGAAAARCVELGTAGAGDWFVALCRARGLAVADFAAAAEIPARRLVVCGSTSPSSRQAVADAREAGAPVVPMPGRIIESPDGAATGAARWAAAAVEAVDGAGWACLAVDAPVVPDRAEPIRRAIAETARRVLAARPDLDLVIEGGATGAAVLDALNAASLTPVAQWRRGVVCFEMPGKRRRVALKPGSYPWPAGMLAAAGQTLPADRYLRR